MKDHPVSENLLELARATMQVNLAVGPLDADQAVQRELRELIAQGDARRVGY